MKERPIDPTPAPPRAADTMPTPAERAAARSVLIRIIAQQLVDEWMQEHHASLSLRPLQH